MTIDEFVMLHKNIKDVFVHFHPEYKENEPTPMLSAKEFRLKAKQVKEELEKRKNR